MSSNREFIDSHEEQLIVEAIREAEKNTSGEIRVHIEDTCPIQEIRERVQALFFELEMEKTQQRNAVLFYLSANDRRFYILGDKGIYQKMPEDFWEKTADLMSIYFQKEEFVKGLTEGILHAGNQLKKYFPYQSDDVNELPDEISRS